MLTSVGKIVLEIQKEKLKVQSYYIFCGNTGEHQDWLIECTNQRLDMRMFDHQTDLLIRLCRDMSKLLIKDGETFLYVKKAKFALRYFEFASALAEKAVTYDKPLSESDNHRPVIAALIEKTEESMT